MKKKELRRMTSCERERRDPTNERAQKKIMQKEVDARKTYKQTPTRTS